MPSSQNLSEAEFSRQQKMIAERLREAITNGGGYTTIVERSGIAPASLNRYLKGAEMKISTAMKLALACDVSMEWLISGKDPESAMPADLRHINEVLDYETGERHSMHDVVEFPRYDVRISAGDGALATSERMAGFIAIPRFMLPLHLQHAADHTIGLYVAGDSMVPTLSDNDLILVDTEVSSLVSGSVYAIRNEDEILVKRLNRTMTGDIEVISDNPRYQKQVINAELARRIWEDSETPLRIIGRVVWRGGSAPM